MQKNNSWNLKDIYENKEKLEKDKEELLNMLDKIYMCKGRLTKKKENMLQTFKLYEKALEKLEKIYAYAILNYHIEMKNNEKIKMFKEAEKLDSFFEEKTSFIEPEILSGNEETIRAYLKEEGLEKYKIKIEKILQDKEHTLMEKEEKLFANYQ